MGHRRRPWRLRNPVARESDEQAALFRWAALMERQIPALALLTAVPNGGYALPIQTAVRLKREGLKRGVPDVIWFLPRGGFAGLLIELKSAHGRVRPEQRWWHEQLRAQGYLVTVCRSWGEARDVIVGYHRSPPTRLGLTGGKA